MGRIYRPRAASLDGPLAVLEVFDHRKLHRHRYPQGVPQSATRAFVQRADNACDLALPRRLRILGRLAATGRKRQRSQNRSLWRLLRRSAGGASFELPVAWASFTVFQGHSLQGGLLQDFHIQAIFFSNR